VLRITRSCGSRPKLSLGAVFVSGGGSVPRMSSGSGVVGSGRFNEEIRSFAGLSGEESGNGVRFRELDLAVRDALAGKDATFIDVEAISAEVGSRHTLFGAHHGGPVMQEIRAQVCAACRRRVAARPRIA